MQKYGENKRDSRLDLGNGMKHFTFKIIKTASTKDLTVSRLRNYIIWSIKSGFELSGVKAKSQQGSNQPQHIKQDEPITIRGMFQVADASRG